MTPTVSVVMAAKNYARFLPQAVRSVFAQTFTDWELVVIDDGSADHTPAAVKPFLTDRRVTYVRSDRLGQSRAKNLGVRLSRGALIAFLDADDAWEPTKLAKQLAVLNQRPEVGVCHTGRVLMDEQGRVQTSRDRAGAGAFGTARVSGLGAEVDHTRPADAGGSRLAPSRSRLVDLFLHNSVCFSSVVVRRVVFDQVGGFDPEFDLAIDYDLWLRVARHWQFAEVPEPLVLYRTGHGNLSKKLSDRVATAVSIMTRHAFRRGLADELPPGTVAEGFSSTCNTLGYVLRAGEPAEAVRWYARGLGWGGRRVESAKGMAAAVLRWLSGRRTAGYAENAKCNR